MIYKYSLFLLFVFSINAKSQIFWSETFTNGCASGCQTYTGPNGAWSFTSTGINDASANAWYVSCAENGNAAGVCGTACAGDASLHVANVSTSPGAGAFCPAGDCGAAYDAGDLSNSVRTSKRAESPIISCAGFTNITLSFNYIENGQATSDDATLWYFDGVTWAQLHSLSKTATSCGGVGLWTAFSIALPASANNNPGIKIGFNWVNNDDNTGSDPSFAVDDIDLTNCLGASTNLIGNVTTPLAVNVHNGLVYAFKHQPGSAGLDTIDIVSLDANGNYNFINLSNDDYLIKVIADANDFPLAVPTYFGNTFQWDSSLIVNHGCLQNDTANIQLLEVSTTTGSGFISGYIVEQAGFGTGRLGSGIKNPNVPFAPGGPLKGVDVKLGKNPGGGIQARTMTDSTGYYEFDSIPLQGYTIYVDIPNLPMDSTHEVTLATGTEISVQNNYFADSASVYIVDTLLAVGIYSSEKVYDNHFSIFPNPAKDHLSVSLYLKKEGIVTIKIYNSLGQTILSENINNISAGTFNHKINIVSMNLKAGVYFISALNENKKYTRKIIVIE